MEWYLVHNCVRPGLDSLFIFCIEEYLLNRSGITEGLIPVFKSRAIWGQRKGLFFFIFSPFFFYLMRVASQSLSPTSRSLYEGFS